MSPGSQVFFRWLGPGGSQAARSATITVGADGRAAADYTLATDAPVGQWAVALMSAANGLELVRYEFEVQEGTLLSLTITDALVDFGALDPDQLSAIESIVLIIEASLPYTLTRTVSGAVSEMGLTISGGASRSFPAGTRVVTDTLQARPPWTTDPEIPLEVTISYTLVP